MIAIREDPTSRAAMLKAEGRRVARDRERRKRVCRHPSGIRGNLVKNPGISLFVRNFIVSLNPKPLDPARRVDRIKKKRACVRASSPDLIGSPSPSADEEYTERTFAAKLVSRSGRPRRRVYLRQRRAIFLSGMMYRARAIDRPP